MNSNSFGKLFLVPNLLGATKPEQVIPAGTLEIVKRLKHFVVENTRTSRRVLSRIGMDNAIDDIEFIELDKHNARNLDLMEFRWHTSHSLGRSQRYDFSFDGLWI